jgi:hypothetical protein
VIPLVRSLERVIGHTPLLDFIDSFRYPLAGEYSIKFETAMELPIESGWGLEIGSLCELHRHLDPVAVCQVDLAISYDHKHRILDPGLPGEGLLHTASEVAVSLLTHLEREGCRLDAKTLENVEKAYRTVSKDFVRRYQHTAILNGYRLIYRASSGQPMRLPKHYPKPVLILFEEHGAAAFRHGAGFCDPTGDRSSKCSRNRLRVRAQVPVEATAIQIPALAPERKAVETTAAHEVEACPWEIRQEASEDRLEFRADRPSSLQGLVA